MRPRFSVSAVAPTARSSDRGPERARLGGETKSTIIRSLSRRRAATRSSPSVEEGVAGPSRRREASVHLAAQHRRNVEVVAVAGRVRAEAAGVVAAEKRRTRRAGSRGREGLGLLALRLGHLALELVEAGRDHGDL